MFVSLFELLFNENPCLFFLRSISLRIRVLFYFFGWGVLENMFVSIFVFVS